MTSHFTLEEFARSETAARLALPNRVPREHLTNAYATLAMLERIRAFLTRRAGFDVPMTISSGYRSEKVNAAVGSRPTSDHVIGAAADWRAPVFGSPLEICKLLAVEVDRLAIGQLINEFPGPNGWVHTSIMVPAAPVNRVLTVTAGRVMPGVLAG